MPASHERVLCRLIDIPDGHSRGFLRERRADKIFVVRRGERVYAYLNSCPHNWVPMDFRQDYFLNPDRSEIVCYAHGAHFSIESGLCTAGVCAGEYLIKVPARIENGEIVIPADLPRSPRKTAAT